MKNATTLFVLSALALTACSEDGSSTSTSGNQPAQQGTMPNPFGTESAPASDKDPAVLDDILVVDPPAKQEPDVPRGEPATVPSESSSNIDVNSIINGSSVATATTLWACSAQGSSTDNQTTDIAFFADGDMTIAEADETLVLNWTSNGPYLELSVVEQYLGRLDNVVVSESAGTLSFLFTLTDGESGSLACDLMDVDNAPVTRPDRPVNDDGSDDSSPSSILLNAIVDDELQTGWRCELADESPIVFFFIEAGQGGMLSNEYPAGILMNWVADVEGARITLEDSNQITLSPLMFSGDDFFQVDTVSYLGMDIPGMECQRGDL
ncbi:MAG: hypothetical protein AB8B64_23360 [Granulosicoccus sp.]